MIPLLWRRPLLVLMLGLAGCGLVECAPSPVSSAEVERLYADTPPPVQRPLRVYHIGHSLVGRDMPVMLEQLAGEGHHHNSQLGAFAELKTHWTPELALRNGETANAHPRFREAHDAVGSGSYDAIVLTERVDIADSIKDHESWRYLSLWAEKTWANNPEARVYVYETWNSRKVRNWAARLDTDLPDYWEGEILDRAMAVDGLGRAIYVIPAGQVLAALERQLSEAPIAEITSTEAFFRDHIHLNDKGHYLVALTHYAVLYGRSPVGLPHQVKRADGTPAEPLSPEAAGQIQKIVWSVVTRYLRTGVTQ